MRKLYKAKIFESTYNFGGSSPLIEVVVEGEKGIIDVAKIRISRLYTISHIEELLDEKHERIKCDNCDKQIRSDFYMIADPEELKLARNKDYDRILIQYGLFCSKECHKLEKLKE